MEIFIDIDQTISSGYVGKSVQDSIAYYRSLGIDIPHTATKYTDFFQLPEVVKRHEVLPGALPGVQRLAQLGNIDYATVRAVSVEEITCSWLQAQMFPSAMQVIFCRNMQEKLLAIAKKPGMLVLVDDRWKQVLAILEVNRKNNETLDSLCQRLILVTFGASVDELPSQPIIPLVSLPSWSGVEDVIQHLLTPQL